MQFARRTVHRFFVRERRGEREPPELGLTQAHRPFSFFPFYPNCASLAPRYSRSLRQRGSVCLLPPHPAPAVSALSDGFSTKTRVLLVDSKKKRHTVSVSLYSIFSLVGFKPYQVRPYFFLITSAIPCSSCCVFLLFFLAFLPYGPTLSVPPVDRYSAPPLSCEWV